ncbi:DUF2142 domain-containing protein [Candidatus Kirkpatrickella diaphorinae]|uniref:DUF2142 domain-containing protein n=1 Tax=Candidatus Kirkpatrickella diaphorinae TaxID=2984322 RepID=A0ABY6GJG4_9PROT|nr:DUF2142 domain-containing protein [Candidatus Kirkpatrickella diaphorinae]UYH51667.1 DUF2142 domain-containing protein [Candidatus Kirkpatrickella diaphorinae]
MKLSPQITLYGVLTACFLLLFCFAELPFMEPDSGNHFRRAFQIAHGQLIGKKVSPVSSGGESLKNFEEDQAAYFPGFFDRHWKVPAGAHVKAQKDTINGPTEYSQFSNTVIYEPIFYLPDAVAINIARIFDFSVFDTMHLMRVLTAITSFIITLIALMIVPANRRFLLLFVVSIPEVLLSYASISYDALLIAFSVLASAALCKAYEAETYETKRAGLILFFAVSSIIVASKPPYVSILLFPVLTTPLLALPFRKILGWTALSFLPTIFWGAIGIRPVITPTWVGRSDVTGQIAYLLHHPFQIFSITYNTVTRHGAALLAQSIGTIRWYGAWLPISYYIFVGIAFLLLLIAFVALIVRSRGRRVPLILMFLNFPLCAFLVSLSIYLTWDGVGDDNIWGINGRYFTAIMVFVPILFFLNGEFSAYLKRAEKIVTYIFLPVSLLITLWTLVSLNYALPI